MHVVHFLPMYFAAFWMLLPLFLLIFGPLSFEINNPILLFLYIAFNALCLCFGYRFFGVKRLPISSSILNLRKVNSYVRLGFVWALILLPISIYVYTGKTLFDIATVLDQGEVYADLLESLQEESFPRKVTSMFRGFTAPLTLAVIPLAAHYWSRIQLRTRLYAVGTVFCMILFSSFRGTDKEIGDILIMLVCSILGLAARNSLDGKGFNRKTLFKFGVLLVFLCLIFVAAFTLRKSERLGGLVSFCLYENASCFEQSAGSDSFNLINFAWAMLSSYLVQGYYGLSLALPLSYEWTYGIGHSPALQTILGFVFDTKSIYENGLTAQLRNVNWDDRYVWSSIFPALASDISFYGVPMLFVLIGYVYGRSWSYVVANGNYAAIVVFALFTILIIYIPANNQLAQSFDYYFATIFWISNFLLYGNKHVHK